MKFPSYNTIRNIVGNTSAALACAILFSACATSAPTSFPSAQAPTSVLSTIASNSANSGIAMQSSAQQAYNGIDDVGPDAANVQIKSANTNKHFVLRPLGTDTSDAGSAQMIGNDYIKIIGSYFPKVVYREPQLNSKLLMRVAPGSTFPLEKLDDGWYQINTKQGSGFLRLQDGKPTNTES